MANIPLSDSIGGADSFAFWLSSKKISAAQAMRINNGWVYACVRAIAEALAGIKFKLYEVQSNGDYEEVFDHEVLTLLNSLNPHQTGYEGRYATAAHLELAGNSYWLLDGVEKEGDLPTAIFPLNPQYMKVIKDVLPNFIKQYEYKVGNSQTVIYQPYQILHFKYPDPNDAYEGIGTVQAIMQWIDSENYATEVNRQYFINGARMSGVLSVEQELAPEQMEYLRKSFEQVYTGVSNAYKVGMMPAGVKYDELGQNPKDMDFSNLQVTMRDKILAGFRVPKTILGVAESETNRATAETANYVFSERTIKPKITMIVQYLNEKLVSLYGDNLVLDFEDPTLGNRELAMNEMTAAMAGQATMSINEAREQFFGLPGIENGDAVMGNFSNTPIGAPKPKAVQRSGQKNKSIIKTPAKTVYSKVREAKKTMTTDITERLVKNIENLKENANQTLKQKDITKLTDEEYEPIYKSFLSRVIPHEKEQLEVMKKFNDDQQEEIIKLIPDAMKSLKDIETKANFSTMFKLGKWITILTDLSTPIHNEVYGTEREEAAKLVGVALPDITPEATRAIKAGVELMARSYNETTLALIEKVLDKAEADGLAIDTVKERINSLFDYNNEVRAGMIAKTETFRTANNASRDAWQESGVVKELKWYTSSADPCEYCQPLNGTVISIEENFFDKGDTVAGRDGGKLDVSYADVSGGSLHVNCQCYIRPETISLRD
ncbi:MAG: phage portal protein [bacterium]|nr:phage portal protein [bacterium]